MKKIKNNLGHTIAFFLMGVGGGLLLLFAVARISWHGKFYPGVTLANIEIGGLTREEARLKVAEQVKGYNFVLEFNGSSWPAPVNPDIYLLDESLNEAYRYGRRAEIIDYLRLVIGKKTSFPLKIAEGRDEQLNELISEIAEVIEMSPVEAEIVFKNDVVVVVNGQNGIMIDQSELDLLIKKAVIWMDTKQVVIPTKIVKRQLNDEQIELLKKRAKLLFEKNLTLHFEDENLKLSGKELIGFLGRTDESEIFNKDVLTEYTEGLSTRINREPQNAKFEFEANKVVEFAPGRDGLEVTIELTVNSIEQGMRELLESEEKHKTVEIVVTRTPPQVTTDKVNELGIRERIGRGESYYAHSIPNRIYNVALASSRLNTALVPPGEEVSFNKLVGEVSGATGYRPAYIISAGRTVLGDGGGLCQVSTTMFRAAMSAGLPILERWGHSYRVSYYELNSKPGVDATVIAPSKDFRFKNDTPGHILIQTINDPKNLHLVIEIYGTSDGRVATISEPKVWGITPPLPTIYQDDPTLPAGTLRQVDWAASGAKASFDYKVVRNGETIQDRTFSTTYRSWASVFLRGTGI